MDARYSSKRRWMVIVAATTLLASACGSDSAGDEATAAGAADATDTKAAGVTTLVGKVDGTDAYIAIQDTGEDTLVYLCDGERIWTYLDGTVEGDTVTGTAPGGASVEATIDADGASGSVTLPDATVHTFRAVQATGDAGLFALATQDADTLSLGSWIRLGDGTIRGKTVEIDQTGDGAPVAVDDGGGAVPPAADPEPAQKRVSLLKCAIAVIKSSQARKEAADNPTAANIAARDAAKNAANAACSGKDSAGAAT